MIGSKCQVFRYSASFYVSPAKIMNNSYVSPCVFRMLKRCFGCFASQHTRLCSAHDVTGSGRTGKEQDDVSSHCPLHPVLEGLQFDASRTECAERSRTGRHRHQPLRHPAGCVGTATPAANGHGTPSNTAAPPARRGRCRFWGRHSRRAHRKKHAWERKIRATMHDPVHPWSRDPSAANSEQRQLGRMSPHSLRAVHIVGGGLAGSEAAWQIARARRAGGAARDAAGARRPTCTRPTALAELVCSNSFRSDDREHNAVGLLHEEMRRLGSLVMRAADDHQVPAGGALAVDRDGFRGRGHGGASALIR